MSVLSVVAPKVIRVRVDNSTTTEIACLLREHAADILDIESLREELFFELG